MLGMLASIIFTDGDETVRKGNLPAGEEFYWKKFVRDKNECVVSGMRLNVSRLEYLEVTGHRGLSISSA